MLLRSLTPSTLVGLVLALSLTFNILLLRKAQSLKGALQAGVSLPAGATAPPLEMRDLEGKRVAITFRDVKSPTVLYIFRPGCGWCDRNRDNLKAVLTVAKEKYRFVGVSLSSDGTKDALTRQGIDFPAYNDISPLAVSYYKLGPTPQTIVISTDGRVQKNWVGVYMGELGRQIESYFKVRLPGLTDQRRAGVQ